MRSSPSPPHCLTADPPGHLSAHTKICPDSSTLGPAHSVGYPSLNWLHPALSTKTDSSSYLSAQHPPSGTPDPALFNSACIPIQHLSVKTFPPRGAQHGSPRSSRFVPWNLYLEFPIMCQHEKLWPWPSNFAPAIVPGANERFSCTWPPATKYSALRARN